MLGLTTNFSFNRFHLHRQVIQLVSKLIPKFDRLLSVFGRIIRVFQHSVCVGNFQYKNSFGT